MSEYIEKNKEGGFKISDIDIDPFIFALADALDIDAQYVEPLDENNTYSDYYTKNNKVYVVTNPHVERGFERELTYIVLSEDEAEDLAREHLWERYRDEGVFDLPDHLIVMFLDEDFFEEVYREETEAWLYDLEKEDLLEYATDWGIDTEDYEDDFDMDSLREVLLEYKMEQESDFVMAFLNEYERENLKYLLDNNPQAFDAEGYIDFLIAEWGVGDVIATYDGKTVELEVDGEGSYLAFAVEGYR